MGLTAAASCAAIRAKLTNPRETRFIDSNGEWIVGHEVPLERAWRGRARLAQMAAMAIEEAMAQVPKSEWHSVPLLLCVAEPGRPGRMEGLDDRLFGDVERALDGRFAPDSAVVPHGSVAVAVALLQARGLLQAKGYRQVVIAAVDSLLHGPTLSQYERQDRLLTSRNSNGFMPGEGAGAMMVRSADADSRLVCGGLGFGMEAASIDAEEPLRADGLSQAIHAALADAGCEMHDMHFRMTDLSGEQYYFKEAALALARTLRRRKEEFDLWHPAECTGELGAAAGAAMIALADAACQKRFAKGPRILAHMADDGGRRAAIALQFRGTP